MNTHLSSTQTSSNSYYLSLLLILLLVKTIFMLGIILYAGIGLGPDEAQYWTWSRALDWGYYSKPPGIAWQIWLGTKLLGHTELGVRFVSILIAIAQSIAVYFLARACSLSAFTSFWSALIMAFCPLGLLGSLFAITDEGFLLFWTIACTTVAYALTNKKEPNSFLIAFLLACGALFKWPIYYFWIFFFIARWQFFRSQLLWKSIAAVFLSLIGLLPSLWWNWSHDWATFRHVSATMQGGSAQASHGNFFEFLGSQAALFSPILFVLLALACWNWIRQYKLLNSALQFCGMVTIGCLAFFMGASLFQKIQGNWSQLVYPTASILVGWYCTEDFKKKSVWLKTGLTLSVLLTSTALLIPSIQAFNLLHPYSIAYKVNPFKHNIGWTNLRDELMHKGYDPENDFLFSDRYQTTSLLSFYNKGQKRAYFLNLSGIRNNQFSYWPSLQEEQKGKTGFFVWVENAPHLQKDWQTKLPFYEKELKNYFEEVEFLGFSPLFFNKQEAVKGAFIFRCKNCKDHPPLKSSLY